MHGNPPRTHTHTANTNTSGRCGNEVVMLSNKEFKKKTLTRRIRRWVSLNRDEPRQKNDSCVCKCHTNPPERAGRRGGSPLEQKKKKVCSFIRGGHSANLGVFSQQLKHTEKNYQSLKKNVVISIINIIILYIHTHIYTHIYIKLSVFPRRLPNL